MADPHLVLLHPPSTYDYGAEGRVYGLLASSIPSSARYEYFPIGFLSILEYLKRNGFSTRIVNLAAKTRRGGFRVDKLISSLRPMAFGIDFHWLVHVDGALHTCRMVKRFHPETPVIVGGLSASYYHKDVIRYPYVDYVLRGDSTEEPLLGLLRGIDCKGDLSKIPNLTWKRGGEIRVNPLSHLPETLDGVFDYRNLLSSVFRYRDLTGNLLTGVDWPVNFASMLLFCRGCTLRCPTCGGSNWALGRRKLALKEPATIAEELSAIQRFSPFYVALFGDIRQGDSNGLLEAIKRKRIRNSLGFELFWMAKREFFKEISRSCSRFQIRISPETYKESIRRLFGKDYDNEALEKTIRYALEFGAEKVWLFFMVGLPHQTRQHVRDTLESVRDLLDRFSKTFPRRIEVFISPLEPFIDPGSPAFESPSKYGYRLLFRSLEDHRKAVRSSTWRDVLNYETEAMSRAELVDVSYEAAIKMQELRRDFGLERNRVAARNIERWTKEKLTIRSSVASHQVC